MKCPSCGAPCAADAAWCSLCFYRFAGSEPATVVEEPRLRSAVAIPFAGLGAIRARRVRAVLVGLGAIAGGSATWLGLSLLAYFLTWGDDPGAFPVVMGAVVAALGIALAVLLWIDGGRTADLTVEDDALVVRYPGFARPLVVPRALVRLVALDDRPVVPLRSNHRFRVAGDVPAGAFVDALDQYASWRPPPISASIAEPAPPAEPSPGDGWATVGASPVPGPPPEEPWLYRGDGAALPVLRLGPGDVPNVAILFHERLLTPRPPLARMILDEPATFQGGRRVQGLMLRVADVAAVGAALHPWSVVRDPTTADVLDEGLSLTKPLRGWRIPVFALVLFAPLLLRLITRG